MLIVAILTGLVIWDAKLVSVTLKISTAIKDERTVEPKILTVLQA